MMRYSKQTKLLLAIDCIVLGFDGDQLNILLVKRKLAPEAGNWSLMGGFLQPDENLPQAADRVLTSLTGLNNVYLEELHSFSKPNRDPVERTVSITYFALIDIKQYQKQITADYHAEWFPLKEMPDLIFDHSLMVEQAKKRVRYKAALHPILFELMPPKFTLPQLQTLYENVYDQTMDKGNFSRKVISTGLLVKQTDKDKLGSKKGAFYYKLNKKQYAANFNLAVNIIPNPVNYYA